jgi:AcrR family transcriptional regulator
MTLNDNAAPLLRRDAQANRDRLVRAAVEIFSTEGFDVPLERVAERAQVGRATLYRNFPDREALSVAVLQTYLDDLSAKVAECGNRSDALFVAIRALAVLAIESNGFQKIVPIHLQAPAYSRRVRIGLQAILREPLARAKAAGLVRPDFDIDEVHLLSLMVAAGGLENLDGDVENGMDRAIRLLTRGLAPTT